METAASPPASRVHCSVPPLTRHESPHRLLIRICSFFIPFFSFFPSFFPPHPSFSSFAKPLSLSLLRSHRASALFLFHCAAWFQQPGLTPLSLNRTVPIVKRAIQGSRRVQRNRRKNELLRRVSQPSTARTFCLDVDLVCERERETTHFHV